MEEHGIYFATKDFYQLIRRSGGQWNDSKDRPIVCLMKSKEHPELYWAIPIGKWNHREDAAKERIEKYLHLNKSNIQSCFYHIGNTDTQSIFFLSDAIPITQKYIEREYKGKYTGELYVIKNKKLLSELEYKLKRILAWENGKLNFFRQHISEVKKQLLNELQ